MMAIAEVDMRNLANRITMTVRLKRHKEWRWRLWLGVKLIQLAAFVMWMRPDVSFDDA